MNIKFALGFAFGLGLLVACGTPAGSEDGGSCPVGKYMCPCDEGNTCDPNNPDLVCMGGTCVSLDGSTGDSDEFTTIEPTSATETGGCTVGALDCACYPNDTCDPDLVCEAGVCVMDTGDCPDGALDCACYEDGTCDDGLTCDADVCVDCTPGNLGCECFPNDSCFDQLVCSAGTCEVCEGIEGCPCFANDTCFDGFECVAGECVAPCPVGTDGCPCDANMTCDNGLACVMDLCEPAP